MAYEGGKDNMTKKLLRYIPKRYHDAVKDIYRDDDGYWVYLKDGWIDGIMGTHVIHTNTVAELRDEARLIEKD